MQAIEENHTETENELFNCEAELLHFATAGSVDDGKSTLIGRLLVDAKGVYEDQLNAAENFNQKKGGEGLDLALLTDGLQAEREQGITIDVAYRYFATPKRKFIIADTPGHEQYTRNMVTGASTADLAIVLIDARKGLLTQSFRHAYLSNLLGIRHIVVAINKMDLVDYSEEVYNKIHADVSDFANRLAMPRVECVPLSALQGDMVVSRGDNMDWYTGRTLLDILETTPISESVTEKSFRFPVQLVSRPQTDELHDFRGYMGRIEAGVVNVGDEITVFPSGLQSKIKEILTFDGQLDSAFAPQSVTLTLEDEIDITRGDMLVSGTQTPRVEKQLRAKLCWLNEEPLAVRKKYELKHGTNSVKALITNIEYKIDVNTLAHDESVEELQLNEIAEVTIKVQKPLVCDAYTDNRTTGNFILIDTETNNTVAAGMISAE